MKGYDIYICRYICMCVYRTFRVVERVHETGGTLLNSWYPEGSLDFQIKIYLDIHI